VDVTVRPAVPRIFFYDPLGAQFQAVNHAASGSGSGTIRSVLAFQERHGSPRPLDMIRTEAVAFALRLLMTAAEFDSATGGVNPDLHHFATMKILSAGGVETVSDDAQRAALREVEAGR
jgi:proteasome beta subunit